MSNPPPERPTEPLPPAQRAARVEERVASPDPVLMRVEDALDSLRTGMMIVGVIAVAALGVAIYSLVSGDEAGGSGSGAASDSRVAELDDRVDRISNQVQDLREADRGDGDAELAERVESLEGTVKQLAERPAPDATQAVQELSERIDDIAEDVEQLQSAPSP